MLVVLTFPLTPKGHWWQNKVRFHWSLTWWGHWVFSALLQDREVGLPSSWIKKKISWKVHQRVLLSTNLIFQTNSKISHDHFKPVLPNLGSLSVPHEFRFSHSFILEKPIEAPKLITKERKMLLFQCDWEISTARRQPLSRLNSLPHFIFQPVFWLVQHPQSGSWGQHHRYHH